MKEPRKGATVVITEGPEQGTQGTLEGVYRCYDQGTRTTRKMCTIRVIEEVPETALPKSMEATTERVLRTRLNWIREVAQ